MRLALQQGKEALDKSNVHAAALAGQIRDIEKLRMESHIAIQHENEELSLALRDAELKNINSQLTIDKLTLQVGCLI